MNREELTVILQESNARILQQFDAKLTELKRSISEDHEAHVDSAVKRIKLDSSVKWKMVGNEKQFTFNTSIEEKFDAALSAIEKGKIAKAMEELGKKFLGKTLLKDRQKQIKLPDRSECGWATVTKYLADDLADGVEDEKRISKAEKAAKKALEDKKAEKAKNNASSFKPNWNMGSDGPVYGSGEGRGGNKFFRGRSQSQFNPSGNYNPTFRRSGVCFACGAGGHWRDSCPSLHQWSPRKSSDKYNK